MDNSTVIDAKAIFVANQEEQWLVGAQQGDQQAFHHLYKLYHRRIYALCLRMLADTESAEDVCQEVFVQLWQKITTFRGDSKFSTWLYSVATNTVLSHLRKHKNWLQRVFTIEDNQGHDIGEEMPELSELDVHIMRLPERARMVFVLFAVEGYRHEEIASMLHMAVGSSKAQYHRARGLLKEWLAS